MMQITHFCSKEPCADSEFVAQASAACVETLQRALQQHAAVTLLLSGGSTPMPVYRALARAAIDWSRITIALVDERWVDTQGDASNEHAIRAALINHIQPAQFVGMKTAHDSAAAALAVVETQYRQLPPLALAVLGMGVDGHVASWFAQAQGLSSALQDARCCAAIYAQPSAVTGPYVERMTVTRHFLATAQQLLLLLTGADKWRTFVAAQQAAAAGDQRSLPVAALFAVDAPLQVLVAQ